jgi:hypothetical protein
MNLNAGVLLLIGVSLVSSDWFWVMGGGIASEETRFLSNLPF